MKSTLILQSPILWKSAIPNNELTLDSLVTSDAVFNTNQLDDPYEPNNSLHTAYNLTTKEQKYLSNIKGKGKAFDDDFYKIEVTPGSLNLVIELKFAQANGNLDLFLLDKQGNLIAASISTSDNELIDVTVEEPGIYYIQVTPVDRLGNSYDLRWDDVVVETAFRSINGQNNNLTNPDWGATHTQLLRLTTPAYADNISEPRGWLDSTLPSAREISNVVAAQSESIPNSLGLSDLFWQWGQFIDHDIDLTESAYPLEYFPIQVPLEDSLFDPDNTGIQTISLNRSIYDPSTGTDPHNPRQQTNGITAYIDGSMIYGSDEATANALRTHDGTGKLLTTLAENGEILLPFAPDHFFFMAGDVRVNEQMGLTAFHTLFVREHNRIADKLCKILDKDNNKAIMELFHESQMSKGDFIYQATRRIVGAEIQIITYGEFLPLLIGDNALEKYTGYDPTVNAGISNEFSTAAFRVGHTMLSPQLLRVKADGSVEEEIALRDAFFNPGEIVTHGVDSLLRGLGAQTAQEIDTLIIDDVRNFLFGSPGAGGFDLASLNIQRGRDHGLADINTVREQLGLSHYNSFDELTGGDTILAGKFAAVYGSIDEVDLWMGGLAEQQVPRAVVGETFQTIIANQFTRLRDGDRFWHEIDPYLDVFKGLIAHNITLADVIKANSTVTDIQGHAFIALDADLAVI